MYQKQLQRLVVGLVIMATTIATVSCSSSAKQQETAAPETTDTKTESREAVEILKLPQLQAAGLGGEPLKVIATTSIIGDVVAQVGGDDIELMTLIGPGQDPHGYEPAARDLTAVAVANLIFVNGWDLEEALARDLQEIGQTVSIVPISANIEPLTFGKSTVDPHVWFSIPNVKQWVMNVEHTFSALDPANAETYARNAENYLVELDELEEYTIKQLAQIPEENRLLVTNHDSLGYFADEYNFTVVGTVIPAASTLAEPSASDFVHLIGEMEAHDICTIFTEATVSNTLAQTVSAELDGCEEVKIIQLYSGAVGPTGSGADSYIGMFRANVDAIVEGLQ